MRRHGERLHIRALDVPSVLSARSLSRSRPGGARLLDSVSFTAFTGEVVAIVGPSGAGKTTLLQALSGDDRTAEGDLRFDGQDFHALLQADPSLVGIVPQDDVLHGELSVRESLDHAARLRLPASVSDAQRDEAVARVLEQLGLEDLGDHRVGSAARRGVSGGQRKRVNLGHALVSPSTRVLFLDEPTSGLDSPDEPRDRLPRAPLGR